MSDTPYELISDMIVDDKIMNEPIPMFYDRDWWVPNGAKDDVEELINDAVGEVFALIEEKETLNAENRALRAKNFVLSAEKDFLLEAIRRYGNDYPQILEALARHIWQLGRDSSSHTAPDMASIEK